MIKYILWGSVTMMAAVSNSNNIWLLDKWSCKSTKYCYDICI